MFGGAPPPCANGAALAGGPVRGHQQSAVFIALFMDRGDHQPHRHADIHERGLGQLQAGFNRLGNGVAGAQLIKPRGVR